jgi:hypothetical protein
MMMEDMEVDKSEDELELERLVFGDARGIKDRIKGAETTIQKTDLEHLEDDQVCSSPRVVCCANYSYL